MFLVLDLSDGSMWELTTVVDGVEIGVRLGNHVVVKYGLCSIRCREKEKCSIRYRLVKERGLRLLEKLK